MSKHTPGSWAPGSAGYGNVRGPGTARKFRRVRSGDIEVARVWCGAADDEPRDSSPHDLMLILAAPDLLAAAEELLASATKFGFVDESYSALPVIHEAIVKLARACRKAEGRGE